MAIRIGKHQGVTMEINPFDMNIAPYADCNLCGHSMRGATEPMLKDLIDMHFAEIHPTTTRG